MACATATFPELISFHGRPSRGVARRVAGPVVVGLGTVGAACATVTLATGVAAWIFATAISVNLNFHTKASFGLGTAALTDPYRWLGDTADVVDAAGAPSDPTDGYQLASVGEVQRVALPKID